MKRESVHEKISPDGLIIARACRNAGTIRREAVDELPN